MTASFSSSVPWMRLVAPSGDNTVDPHDPHNPRTPAESRPRPVVAGGLYLIEDAAQRCAFWERLLLDQRHAIPDVRVALLVALAEAIGSLSSQAERTRAMTQILVELPCLPQPQQVELISALGEQISLQPAVAFRKAAFDDLNTFIAKFEGCYRHAAYVQILAKIDRADADTVNHVFGEIIRCTGNLDGASGATLVTRLATMIRFLPARNRLPRFASLNSVLRHPSIAQQAALDIALLDAIAFIDDPLERACAFSSAVSTLARLPEHQRQLAGAGLTRAFNGLAPHLKPAAFNELLMLASLCSAPRMVERLLELIPLTASLAFHQTAMVFSWMEALTAACPQREQGRIYAAFFHFTNSILAPRPRQTLRRWIQCRLSRLNVDGMTFFSDEILADALTTLAHLRISVESNSWDPQKQQAFDALVDLTPSLPLPCRAAYANAMCNLIWAANRAGRPYSSALWESFAPNLTSESQALMTRRLGFPDVAAADRCNRSGA